MEANRPISVIIAAWPDPTGTGNCLESLASQRDDQVEILVSSPLEEPKFVRERFPWVQWKKMPSGCLIPHLWAEGIAHSTGGLVAITTSNFDPSPDWIRRIREAHTLRESAGIGGPIDPPRGGNSADWAIYFLRYSKYFGAHGDEVVSDIPGDNASYKREALELYRANLRDGFWEIEFHRMLLAAGKSLRFSPSIRVRQNSSFGFRDFCAQRFRHGRQFGLSRVRAGNGLSRSIRIASSPLVPLVLFGKIALRVLRGRSNFGRFLFCLPALLVFISCWSSGEIWSYLTARVRDRSASGLRRCPAD